MDEIKYMLKPDWVTGADIKTCLMKAHEPNRAKGIVMQNQFMTSEELDEYLKDIYCFVALKEKDVIGVMSFKIIRCNQWWAKGQNVIYNCLDAIIPEYKGSDVYFELRGLREKYIKETGLKLIQFATEENNIIVQKICAKRGGKMVKFVASPKTNYYSVVMVKWLDNCPFSDKYINFRFKLSKFLTKLVYKPGKKRRIFS